MRHLWEWVGRTPPWKPHEVPDAGYTLPPEFQGWHLEMKNKNTLSIWSALAQAEEDAGVGGLPVVVFTRARASRYVALKFEDWCGLVVKAAATKQDHQ